MRKLKLEEMGREISDDPPEKKLDKKRSYTPF